MNDTPGGIVITPADEDELLRMAADAAGYIIRPRQDGALGIRTHLGLIGMEDQFWWPVWNPLRKDAQAHHLAAVMKLELRYWERPGYLVVRHPSLPDDASCVFEYDEATLLEIVRYAIVACTARLAQCWGAQASALA